MFHIIVFVLSFILVKCDTNDDGIRTLQQGQVQGTLNLQHNYWTFFDIYYARVSGRFDEAKYPPSFNGSLNATQGTGTVTCKQFDTTTNSPVGVEDCLTLNIYTPAVITKPLPVIVFIFGGGLYKGSNTDDRYNARYLVKKDVLVVTINYRVGAFGFLCLKTKRVPGNIGIKDQVVALRWVKDNIAAFGGDPNSVTLQGESVGGSSINIFIYTSVAKGLFNKAIMHSGNVIRPLFFDNDPISTAADIASRLGYNTRDPDELEKIFKEASADDIVIASTQNSTNNVYKRFPFGTCIEDAENKNAVLTEYPKDLLKNVNKITNISIIMGYDNEEGIMWTSDYNSEGLKELDRNFTSAIPKSIVFKSNESKSLFIDDIRAFYFNNSCVTFLKLIDYFGDALVHYPSTQVMEAFMTNPNISLYNYFFKYSSNRNLYKLTSPFAYVKGATHCDELYYLYDPIQYRQETPTPDDARMIDDMTSLWTSLARTGTPSVERSCDDFKWKRSKKSLRFLSLDEEKKMIGLPDKERINFWRESQEKYGFEYL